MKDNKGNQSGAKICAVILSAGKSSRMGDFKPLLDIGGVPAIKRLIASCKDAEVDEIVVVTGHNREELENTLAGEDIITAYNPDYEEGMFTSVVTGLRKAMEIDDFHAFLLFLTDVPLIPAELIKKMSLEYGCSEHFAAPCYQGKKGHPLLIPAKYAGEILSHDGFNGLKGVTGKYENDLIRIDTNDESVVLDMDVPKDYEEILNHFNNPNPAGSFENIIEETGFNGVLYLLRHGSTKLHKEKIFMGQVDVPLSSEGREEVIRGAKELLGYAPKSQIIYTSPLVRARESAQIIKENMRDTINEIVEVPSFMEMSLGDWDGRFIDDIKKEFPHEYETRGKNILTYKRRPDGENYYDLKYRVIKELRKLMMSSAPNHDLIIVSHKGVINVIRETLLNISFADSISYNPPKGSVTVIDSKQIK